MVGGNCTVIDDTVVRSGVEHEALDDGNRYGESVSYRPSGNHGTERNDERWLPYRVGGLLDREKGREGKHERRMRLNIVQCEQ